LLHQLNYKFLMNKEKLERLLFNGDYSKVPSAMKGS